MEDAMQAEQNKDKMFYGGRNHSVIGLFQLERPLRSSPAIL